MLTLYPQLSTGLTKENRKLSQYMTENLLTGRFDCFDSFPPSQHFFSFDRMISCLPGLNQ